jgi:hypothetical protein
MSNLAKRIQKLSRNRLNVLGIKLSAGEIQILSKIFVNVFVLSIDQPFKSKNVIYIEEKSKTFNLPDVTTIVTDLVNLDTIFLLSTVIARYHPDIILLNAPVDAIQKHQNKSFLSMNYDIYYKEKNTQLWKLRTDR